MGCGMKKQELKVVLIGDPGAGRTALAEAYSRSLAGPNAAKGGDAVNFRIVDPVSTTKYNLSSTRQNDLRRNPDVVMICVDLSQAEQGEVKGWRDEAEHYAPNAKIMVVGTKADIATANDLKSTTADLDLTEVECSSNDLNSVREVFNKAKNLVFGVVDKQEAVVQQQAPKQEQNQMEKTKDAGSRLPRWAKAEVQKEAVFNIEITEQKREKGAPMRLIPVTANPHEPTVPQKISYQKDYMLVREELKTSFGEIKSLSSEKEPGIVRAIITIDNTRNAKNIAACAKLVQSMTHDRADSVVQISGGDSNPDATKKFATSLKEMGVKVATKAEEERPAPARPK